MIVRDTILYADDEEPIRRMVGKFCSKAFSDYGLELYEDGIPLSSRLEQDVSKVACVVTDNTMKNMHGLEVIGRYARDSRFENIPFILMYGGKEEIGKKAIEDGAYAFCNKPVNYPELASVIMEGIASKQK